MALTTTHRRCISIGAALVVGAGLSWMLAPPGSLSPDAVHDLFAVLLPRNVAEAMTPRGGERVLPPVVQEAVALLRDHDVERYRPSPRVLNSGDLQVDQRMVEGAWPIRQSFDAPWYLAHADETLPSDCQPVDQRNEFVLARCP